MKYQCDVQGEVQQDGGRITAASKCTKTAVVNLEGVWYCAEHAKRHHPRLPTIGGSSIRGPAFDDRPLLLDVATIVLFNHNAEVDLLAGMRMHNPDAERDRREYGEAIKRIRAAVEGNRGQVAPDAKTPSSGLDVSVSGGNTVMGIPDGEQPITLGGQPVPFVPQERTEAAFTFDWMFSKPKRTVIKAEHDAQGNIHLKPGQSLVLGGDETLIEETLPAPSGPMVHEFKNAGSGDVGIGDNIWLKPGESAVVGSDGGVVVDVAVGPPYVRGRGAPADRCGGKGYGDATAANAGPVGAPLRGGSCNQPCMYPDILNVFHVATPNAGLTPARDGWIDKTPVWVVLHHRYSGETSVHGVVVGTPEEVHRWLKRYIAARNPKSAANFVQCQPITRKSGAISYECRVDGQLYSAEPHEKSLAEHLFYGGGFLANVDKP